MKISVDSIRVGSVAPGLSQNFRAYWAALGVSQFGSAVTLVTIPLIAVATLGAAPSQMAWLVALTLLPSLLIRVPAAVVADSLRNRLPLMVACSIMQAVAVGTIPMLWWLDALTFPALLVMVAASSLLLGLYQSLASPVMPQIVPRNQLVDANGKISATRSVADIGGPALGSGLLAILAAPLVLLVDALSFLASAALLSRVRIPPKADGGGAGDTDQPPARSPGQLRTIARLAGALLRRSGVQVVLAVGLVNGVVETILVIFMINELHLHPSQVAALLALGAVGGVVGGLAVGRFLARFGTGVTLAAGVLATIGSLALLPFGQPGISGAVGVVLFEIAGSLGGTIIIATVFGGLQGDAPPEVVARVMALTSALLQVAALAGAGLGGILGTAFGTRSTLVVAAALMVLLLTPQLARWAAARWTVDSRPLPS